MEKFKHSLIGTYNETPSEALAKEIFFVNSSKNIKKTY